jgi:hypothetical protein
MILVLDFEGQMAYSEFTIRKVRDDFGLTLVEGDRFLPPITPITPGNYLVEFLYESIPLAVGTGSEKARSELIISPLLVEVRRQTQRQVSVFSGEDFTVDASVGLNGTFLPCMGQLVMAPFGGF